MREISLKTKTPVREMTLCGNEDKDSKGQRKLDDSSRGLLPAVKGHGQEQNGIVQSMSTTSLPCTNSRTRYALTVRHGNGREKKDFVHNFMTCSPSRCQSPGYSRSSLVQIRI